MKSSKRVREIQDMAIELDRNGKPKAVEGFDLQLMMICDSIANKEFDNKEVLKRFGAMTRKELFQTIFNAGEVAGIFRKTQELCGFGDDTVVDKVDEVKN